jgi:hypothetical protein
MKKMEENKNSASYMQVSWNDPLRSAKLVATRESLERLHKMLSQIIGDTKSSKTLSEVFVTSNGEEYDLHVSMIPSDAAS